MKRHMDAIEGYLNTVLTPQLLGLGVQSFPGVMEQVIADVRRRLRSALAHWNEARVRKTILLPGQEEGWFYEPDTASPAVRALVVITIRNSLLEDLRSRCVLKRLFETVTQSVPDVPHAWGKP